MRLLVTGSEGLIGDRLVRECAKLAIEVVPYDLVRSDAAAIEDICDEALVASLTEGCDGIVHLAAISRVAWGEMRPELCRRTNVDGTRAVLGAAMSCRSEPWFLFASSREVYGNPLRDKVLESDPIAPVNIYGRSKADAEALVEEARSQGLRTATLRFSNVYGGRRDHPDRAAPSLMFRALAGEDLVITGGSNYFDFVHVDDCVAGLMAMINHLTADKEALPPIHLATGVATSLGDLAKHASAIGGGRSSIDERPGRPFDVSGFCGSPDRARELLGWHSTIDLRTGLEMLANDMRQRGPLAPVEIPDPDEIRAERTPQL